MSIRVGRDSRSHAWGAPVEKRPRLTLLDEKWFPFRAKKEEHEFLIFASYAFTDSLMGLKTGSSPPASMSPRAFPLSPSWSK